MGLFPLFKRKSADIQFSPSWIPLSLVDSIVSGLTAKQKSYLDLFLTVPELQAIIGYKARVFSGMKIKAQDQSGDLKEVALPEVFRKPNPIQTFKEFVSQYYLLRSIFGNDFIYPVVGGLKDKPKALWNLPAMDAKAVSVPGLKDPFTMTEIDELIDHYEFIYDGHKLKYQPNELIHYNDNQVRFEKDLIFLGDSKLRPLMQACENIKSAYEARGMLIQKSPLGVLSNKTTDGQGTVYTDPEEKKQLQEDFRKTYGMSGQKWHIIMTNANLEWQSMAADVGRLRLFEEVDHDFRAIANQFNFPPEILQTDSTYENKQKAIIQLYNEAIIPEANEFLQGFVDWMGLNYNLVADFSHVAILQADLESRSRSLNLAATGLSKAVESGIVDENDAKEEFKRYLS